MSSIAWDLQYFSSRHFGNVVCILRKHIGIGLALFLLLPSIFYASAAFSGEVSKPLKLFSVPWGDKAGQIGFKPHNREHEDLGPTSFFVTDQGEIYVLDNVNRRINVYNFEGKLRHEIAWVSSYPKDIYVLQNAIYVLTNSSLEKLTSSGDFDRAIIIAGKNSPFGYGPVWKLFYIDNKLIVSQGKGGNNKIECYAPQSVQRLPCGRLDYFFKKYEVVESANSEPVVASDEKIARLDLVNEKITFLEESPYNYVYQLLFEMTSFFRIINNKLYTMEPSKLGVTFYVRSCNEKGDRLGRKK